MLGAFLVLARGVLREGGHAGREVVGGEVKIGVTRIGKEREKMG